MVTCLNIADFFTPAGEPRVADILCDAKCFDYKFTLLDAMLGQNNHDNTEPIGIGRWCWIKWNQSTRKTSLIYMYMFVAALEKLVSILKFIVKKSYRIAMPRGRKRKTHAEEMEAALL
ncbi:hypothetical protein DPMN_125890 [Dreissena polymorpha]|uniref:Uncharacterized protein n=1 Tax=Dreissena polymorpha TaxID=45954 RepID=A0A9D4JXG3_DREPO|nr:hypothetical protein DPMN_125890 [Dreissena polymorpha]